MKYISFSIKNFKGIQDLKLDLDDINSRISTLVGLNESGKTTILEALSFFYEGIIENNELLYRNNFQVESLIPKNKQDNFTDTIEIQAKVHLEELDHQDIVAFLDKNNFKTSSKNETIQITIIYSFQDSTYKGKRTTWNLDIKGKKGKSRKDENLHNTSKDVWLKLVEFLENKLPIIIYYPNFLFDFPDKIYLESDESSQLKETFYRKLIQDILDALNNNLTIEKHIVNRAKLALKGHIQEKRYLDSVLSKSSGHITRTIFDENLSVFRRDSGQKSIKLAYPEQDEQGLFYTSLILTDGEDNYYIRERSLGFKWFVTFLLLTQFRIHRSEEQRIIFLLDEPASNLHQTAQQRLLKALEKLTNDRVSVIYTTHSHHLINPLWLESTFIVKNDALNYEKDETDFYNSFMTNISIEKYRSFVSSHPNQRIYFQPILDVLEYKPSNLENIPNVVMLEGKNDFYTISYFQNIIFDWNDGKKIQFKKLNLLPGMGSGSLDDAIRLYYTWGRNFIILLDSDKEGLKQKDRYMDKFGAMLNNKIFTLGDININWNNFATESLFTDDERNKILHLQQTSAKKLKFNKKKFNLSIQEALVQKLSLDLSQETINNFKSIVQWLGEKIENK